MQTINIGTEINLQDLLQSRMLIQANSGGGKTAICRTLIEETIGKVPFIVFDDAGEYYPLKEKFGDIVIIGGQNGDVPISTQAVTMLPKFIIGNQLSVIIDISDLKTVNKDKHGKTIFPRQHYLQQFLETVVDLPQQYWKPYLFFIEEAHKYCGEQDRQLSAAAIKELMSGGRKKGYCGILITQRIAKLHKDAAAECNNKFVGRTSLDIDMDRSAKELGFTTSSEFTRLSLRDLKPGHFYAYGTSIEPHHVHVVKVKMPQTKLVKSGHIIEIKPKKPTQRLLDAMGKLNDLPAEAEKELKNMQQLQQEVNRLKSELHKASQNSKIVKPQASEKDANHIAVLKNQVTELQKSIATYKKEFESQLKTITAEYSNQNTKWKNYSIYIIKHFQSIIMKYQTVFSKIGKMFDDLKETGVELNIPAPEDIKMPKINVNIPDIKIDFTPPKDIAHVSKSFNENNKKATDNVYEKAKRNNSSENGIPKAARALLTALAMYKDEWIEKDRVAFIAELKPSGGHFTNMISHIVQNNYAEKNGQQMKITPEGLEAVGDFTPLPTDPDQLINYWAQKLGKGPGSMLRFLFERHPHYVTRDELGENVDLKPNTGHYTNCLSALRRLRIIEERGKELKLSDKIF